MQEFKCVLRTTLNTPPSLIKQLVLFYDKIYVMPTVVTGIYPEVWQKIQKSKPGANQKIRMDFFRDTEKDALFAP